MTSSLGPGLDCVEDHGSDDGPKAILPVARLVTLAEYWTAGWHGRRHVVSLLVFVASEKVSNGRTFRENAPEASLAQFTLLETSDSLLYDFGLDLDPTPR